MYILVLTTSKDKQEAEKIIRDIIKDNLAACANILGNINSIFWWKQKIEQEQEVLIIFKTRKDKFPQIVSAIKAIHSYSCPEIIAVPITDASQDYLNWLDDNLR